MTTEIDEITIKGVTYVPKGTQKEYKGDTKIVILQRGWVMVGKLERKGSECKLHNSSTIREWGTTKGLGQIASDGPTATTKLDKNSGIVEFDYLTVICTIACNEDKWK